MAWVVDTCVLLDIGLDDPQFADQSLRLLESKQREELIVCPVTFIPLEAPPSEQEAGRGCGRR